MVGKLALAVGRRSQYPLWPLFRAAGMSAGSLRVREPRKSMIERSEPHIRLPSPVTS